MIRRLLDVRSSADERRRLGQFVCWAGPSNESIELLTRVLTDSAETPHARGSAFLLLQEMAGDILPFEMMERISHTVRTAVLEAAQRENCELAQAEARRAKGSPRRKRKRPAGSGPAALLTLKVTLAGFRPPVWRRLEVREDLTFAEFHSVLQTAFGWTNSHLHEFEVGKERIAPPDDEDELPARDSAEVRLRSVFRGRTRRIRYVYDFGDEWVHTIELEKSERLAPDERPPVRCTAGRRATPPEDSGGPWGYAELLKAISDPKHPDHTDMLWWAGEIDPEAFDREGLNGRLQRLSDLFRFH